jgi:hypothetical protein
MNAVNKFGWKAAGVVTAIASATVIALAAPAGAHVASGPPDVDCNKASVELKDFPNGPSEITFHITVNGNESTKTTQLPGQSGKVSVTISDLTTATGPLDIEAFASWEVDNGGKSDTTKVNDVVCHDEPTTTTEGPPVDVGGVQAERPNVPASVESAAAVAVTAEPRFTG